MVLVMKYFPSKQFPHQLRSWNWIWYWWHDLDDSVQRESAMLNSWILFSEAHLVCLGYMRTISHSSPSVYPLNGRAFPILQTYFGVLLLGEYDVHFLGVVYCWTNAVRTTRRHPRASWQQQQQQLLSKPLTQHHVTDIQSLWPRKNKMPAGAITATAVSQTARSFFF